LEASVITLSPIYVCSFANAHEGLPADHANAVCHSFQLSFIQQDFLSV
jgi:hypothetical protein